MSDARKRRLILMVSVTVGVFITGLSAYACVPQRGGGKVENIDAAQQDFENTMSYTPATDDGFIVGDGDPNTIHYQSWCGGHPTDAVYAEDGDTLEVTVREATEGEVDDDPNDPCPVKNNALPHAGTDTPADIWLENGQNNGEPDVYEWVQDSGFCPDGADNDECWNFKSGDGVGCYFEDPNDPSNDADPVHQGTLSVDSNGDGKTTFDLNTAGGPINQWQDNNDKLNQDPQTGDPGDGAAVLCVGTDADKAEEELTVADEHKAIFMPIVLADV